MKGVCLTTKRKGVCLTTKRKGVCLTSKRKGVWLTTKRKGVWLTTKKKGDNADETDLETKLWGTADNLRLTTRFTSVRGYKSDYDQSNAEEGEGGAAMCTVLGLGPVW